MERLKPKPKSPDAKLSTFAIVVIALVLVTAVVLGIKSVWFAGQRARVGETQENKAATSQSIQDLVTKMARHIVIKQDEEPTVATVQDAQLLKNQNPVFYKDAENGDRLLVWSDKVVLFSESRDLILSVMPINVSPSQPAASSTTQTTVDQVKTEAAKIEVRNGTTKSGVAKTMSAKLAAAGLHVLATTDAKIKDYTSTVIIKLTNKQLPATEQVLMTLTGAKTAVLREGEKASTADYLIIVGNDFSQ